MDHIIYTGILEEHCDHFTISFADDALIPAEGETIEEALKEAREVVALAAVDAEDSGEPFLCQDPSIEDIPEGAHLISIDVWMPYERSKIKETYTKKTLTIPTWLNLLAQQKNINFSKVLTEGIKRELHLA